MDIEHHDELQAYLLTTGRIAPGETIWAQTLAGGVSNRTVLVERAGGERWVLKQALAKLRVQVDWFSDPRRVAREAAGMRRLCEVAPSGTITPLIFEDPAEHLLAMAAVPEPHENWKTMLLSGRVEMDHVRQFGELLGTIHRHGHERRETLAIEFADRSYFESLRLEPYYRFTATRVLEASGALEALIKETLSRRDTLVHGDYSPKNILVHEGRLVLLDHEVIHFGDAAFDLGFALAHLVSKAHHLASHRTQFAHAASFFWNAYRVALGDVSWGDALEGRAVCHLAACLLARARGRSPLEYLSEGERSRQAVWSTELLLAPCQTVPRAIDACIARMGG